MSIVTGVDFITIPVQDLDRAREFYGQTLGLSASKLWQRGEQPAMGAEFETGTVTLALMDVAQMGQAFVVGAGTIALHVEDVAASRAELEARGVEFAMDDMDSGVCNMAFFSDSEGNALMLHHRYAPQA